MVGPLQAIENGYFRAFNFSGRATRAEYWFFALWLIVITLALLFLDYKNFIVAMISYDPDASDKANLLAMWNQLSFYSFWSMLIHFIPRLSLLIRRLHDIGRSGFWVWISLLPIVGPLVILVFTCLPTKEEDDWHGGGEFTYAKAKPSANPYAAYDVLDRLRKPATPEMIAARKAEVSDYYRQRVLGQQS